MKYSYEFKKKCVQLYKQGKWADTPAGIKKDSFHSMIRKWGKLEEFHGFKVLKHIKWNTDEKLAMVSKVLAGNSIYSVATENGINDGQLYTWVHNYKLFGYNELVNKKKGRKSTTMKKNANFKIKELNESEKEELVRLRAEVEYI